MLIEYMAKQRCCFAAPQSGAAERFAAFHHHVIIIVVQPRPADFQWSELLSKQQKKDSGNHLIWVKSSESLYFRLFQPPYLLSRDRRTTVST